MAHRLSLLVMCLALAPAAAQATAPRALADVDVEIVADDGRSFPQHPVYAEAGQRVHRAYLEARDGANYAIRIRNRSPYRVGLVIAVDGRNIISGDKSHLARGESMYVLGPYREATYKGWRTSQAQVHRFYFTDADDSYAMAWGDDSALGVIAVAVYREQPRVLREMQKPESRDRAAGEAAAPAPGTGFGSATQSHAVRVHFDPEPTPVAKHFLKYEWRESLCDRGIISCAPSRNRFWPDDLAGGGFAPYPPGY